MQIIYITYIYTPPTTAGLSTKATHKTTKEQTNVATTVSKPIDQSNPLGFFWCQKTKVRGLKHTI